MTTKQMRCPKCGENHAFRTSPGTEWEELHCHACGLLVHVGALRTRKAEPRSHYDDDTDEAA
jgi:uncharacterized protein (DUF983 family)